MPSIPVILPATTTALDLVGAAALGLGTVAVLLVVGLLVGILILFKRRSGGRGSFSSSGTHGTSGSFDAVPSSASGRASGAPVAGSRGGPATLASLELQAGTTLVRADDAVESAENEVGFAVAQFGDDRTREFADAVVAARGSIAEAFRIKQQLDDAYPESDQQRREMTKRIIALSDNAQKSINEQSSRFTELRRSEADSPARLSALREGIATTRLQLSRSATLLARLSERFVPGSIHDLHRNLDEAARLLAAAESAADAAAGRLSATGVNTVSADLDAAASLVHDARTLLDAVEERDAALGSATTTLAKLVDETRTDLVEARAIRDSAPDAHSGAQVLAAISTVEAALSEVAPTMSVAAGQAVSPGESGSGLADPIDGIETLGDAVTALDTALASARNQQQRLEHSRTALIGALVGARSQISVTKTYMANNRSGVDARTRLAEAERQLLLAESESDPVEALDAARRSTTAARDADALARYNGM